MIDPTHITTHGSASYKSEVANRWVDYTWENEFILPDLSADECLLEEDVINEIRKFKDE